MAAKYDLDFATSNYHHSSAQTTLLEKSSILTGYQIHERRDNHNLDVTSKKETDTDKCSSPDSGIEVCDAIQMLLPLVKDRYKFGICANIEPSELDVIMDQYRDPVQCLSNIVDRWNRTDFTQSWSMLANIVERMQGYDKVVASLRRMVSKSKEKELSSDLVTQPTSTTTENLHLNGKKLQIDRNSTDYSLEQSKKSTSRGFLRFECACGECTIYDHFESKKCSKRANQYPYLEVRGEPYESDIEIYLVEQTEIMRDSFVNLMQDTRFQLQASTTTPYGEIQAYIKLLVAGKAEYDKIKYARNLLELQDALIETCCSWFNHGIIAKIRKNFLHKNERDNILEKYTQHFDTYCKRRCFESPAMLHLEKKSSTESTSQTLVFKVERDFYATTLTDILQVKRALAKILHCEPHAINVCTVKEGCIEVHCHILPIGAISDISTQQIVELKQLDIISFKLEGEELMPEKKPKGKRQTELLPVEPILELSHSPRLHNRKVSTFTFPSQLSTTQATTTTTTTPSIPCKTNRGNTAENRNKVICKIVDSERKYLRQLEVLLNGYQPATKEVTSARDLRLLFPTQLEPMMEKHESLLNQLEVCMEEKYSTSIGDIFARICNSELLNMYGAYLKEFKVAVKILAKCEQTSPQFCKQLSMCQHSFFCEGIGLASYLLSPVQRLPKYELLLKELVKYTPANHPDSHHIANAIDKLHKGLIRLNRSIKLCLLAFSVRQVQDQKSFRFLKSSRKLSTQRHPHATNVDGVSPDDSTDDPETIKRLREEGEEEQIDKLEGRVHSTPRLTQHSSFRSARTVSITCREEGGGWFKSRLSIYSNSSGTSGIGSISTNQSQLDLTIHPLSPIGQNPKLSSVSRSVQSSMSENNAFRSRERGYSDKNQEGGTSIRGRNMSWTNSRLFQKIRKGYVSTANMTGFSDSRPSLCWSEESIEAAMRQEQDIFVFDNFMECGRSAVSCSDLLLHSSKKATKNFELTHLEDQPPLSKPLQHTAGGTRGSSSPLSGTDGDELRRSTSTLSIDSNSSVVTSGIESVTQSQLDLADVSRSQTTKELNLSRLCASLPILTDCCPSLTSSRTFSYSPLPPATATHS